MAEGTPGNPPLVINDPMLEVLTFDQLAQLVNEVAPDAFYQRAAAFDQAAVRLQDVLDQIRHQLNLVQEVWTGRVSEDFDNLVREISGRVTVVLQFLQNPGYGSILRTAGDVLAAHQQRFRDLQGQKAQQEAVPPAAGAPPLEVTAQVNDQSAKQILRDLRTAYQDIGNAIAPLPYTTAQEITVPAGAVPAAIGTTLVVAPSGPSGAAVGAVPLPGTPGAGDPFGFDGPAGQPESEFHQQTAPVQDQIWFALLPPASQVGTVPAVGAGVSPAVLGRLQAQWWQADQMSRIPAGAESGLHQETSPAVLGQAWSAPSVSQADAVGVAGVGVSPAVLGRPQKPDAWRTDKAASKGVGGDRKAVEEICQPRAEHRPETVSAAATIAPADQGMVAETVKTTADVPQTTAPVATDVTRQVATASAQSSSAGQSASAMDPNAATRSLFAVTPSSGGTTAGAIPHPAESRLDPQERGMFVPTAGTAVSGDAPHSAAQPAYPATSSHSVRGSPGPSDPYASQTSGYPISPMMLGGMSGQPVQQNGRIAAVPNEPRPEFWDSPNDTPTALGRPEPQPEPKPAAHEPELSRADAEALLAAKFAELDRLMERGK